MLEQEVHQSAIGNMGLKILEAPSNLLRMEEQGLIPPGILVTGYRFHSVR